MHDFALDVRQLSAVPGEVTVRDEEGGKAMNFDVEHQVLQTATELYELALTETETLNQYEDAVDQLSQDVLERHPDFPVNLLVFAMGRALEDSKADGAFQQ